MSHAKKKRSARESSGDDVPTPKKSTAESVSIVPFKILKDLAHLEKLKNAWLKKENYTDPHVNLRHDPFQYGECKFLENEEFLEEFLDKLATFKFHNKSSDLFQFRQSDDLKSFVDPHIFKIIEYLTVSILPWLKNVTGLPLSGDIDLFLSDYRKNDFLLCHDDELDSRRIAFMIYLNKSWKAEFGGLLDLFSATEDIHPKEVVKSIIPEFNKFAFFAVGSTSFHQVSEVTEGDVKRLALSGWFYGDPVPRPKIEFSRDEGYLLNDAVTSCPDIITQFCSESYTIEATLKDINEQVSEESQVLIPGFLKDDVYQAICNDIVDQDAVFEKFVHVGPPNISCFREMGKGPPVRPPVNESPQVFPQNMQGLQQLFHSTEFLQFMEKVTELPFTSTKLLRVTTSLRKYAKGSYSLLVSGGAKQTGDVSTITGDDDDGHNGDSDDDSEDSGDPNLVDIIYFVASKWNESWGGSTIYSAEDGEQLITIPPDPNCLAIVVRNSEKVNSFVNYINSNAGEEVYFAYTMTCEFVQET